jgi:glycosyltransferase 2 family protein
MPIPFRRQQTNSGRTRTYRLFLTFAILSLLLFFFGDRKAIWSALQNVSPFGLLMVFIATSANRLLMAFKWTRLLRIHADPPGTILATQVYCSAMLLGLFLPSTIGADAARTVVFERLGYSVDHLLSSIVVERFIGMACTLLLALIGLLLLPADVISISFEGAAILAIGSCAVFALAWSVMKFSQDWKWLIKLKKRRFFERASRWLQLLWQSIAKYQSHPMLLGEFAVLTLGEQLLMGIIFWLIAIGLGIEVSFLATLFCAMIAFALSRIPLTPGGIGVFESVFALALATYGVAVSDALLIALVGRFVQIATWSGWWLSFNLRRDMLTISRGKT